MYSDMFAFSVGLLFATRGHSYKLYAKLSSHINYITSPSRTFCNRVVNLWNRLAANDSHFETFTFFKLFLAAQIT